MGRFDNRTRVLIGAVCLFAVATALIALGLNVTPIGIGRDTRVEAVSAVGNRAFMEFLERMGFAVDTDRSSSLPPVPAVSELRVVMAKPASEDANGFMRTRLAGSSLILVLPKWYVTEDPNHPGWVSEAIGLPVAEVEPALDVVLRDGRLVRPTSPVTWSVNELGFSPTLAHPQLFSSKYVHPVLASDEGMLIGEIKHGMSRIWIVADPDLIANHGLHRGDNALLDLAMVEALLPAGGTVVFDTATPVPVDPPGLEDLLFQFPSAIVTVQIAVMCLLLLWASAASFGAPLDLPRPIATGSASLVANMSALLILGGHLRDVLSRYADATTRDVANRLHAPHGLNDRELATWVERVETARGVGESLTTLRRRLPMFGARPDARATMALAASFHHWRQEMIRGPGNDHDR